MSNTIKLILFFLLTILVAAPQHAATNSLPVAPAYRTWRINGDKRGEAKFFRYGNNTPPYTVWIEFRTQIRVSIALDSLADEDIVSLRRDHPNGFPTNYVRRAK